MSKEKYVVVDWSLNIVIHDDDVPESARESIKEEIIYMIQNGHEDGSMETDIGGYEEC